MSKTQKTQNLRRTHQKRRIPKISEEHTKNAECRKISEEHTKFAGSKISVKYRRNVNLQHLLQKKIDLPPHHPRRHTFTAYTKPYTVSHPRQSNLHAQTFSQYKISESKKIFKSQKNVPKTQKV